jgi:branched-chain amino acid transport system permease protein
MTWVRFFNLALAGLTQGAIYAIVACGFNVSYATTGVLNFAHGEFLMLGTMLGVFFYGSLGWPLMISLVLTVALCGGIGALVEVGAVRPALRLGHGAWGWILSTLGVAILLRSIVSLRMGQDLRGFPDLLSRTPKLVGGVRIVPAQILVIVIALLVALGLHLLYERTLVGRALEAVSQDREAAAFRGLPIGALSSTAFGVAAGIAALAGFVAAPLTGASPSVGFPFVLKGFVAAVIGGIPRIDGALAGGLFLGLAEVYGSEYIGASTRNIVVFASLLVFLAFRPQGIFGKVSARTV